MNTHRSASRVVALTADSASKPFIVLDRPNPIRGDIVEGGGVLDPKFRSFVGQYPVALRYGFTSRYWVYQ